MPIAFTSTAFLKIFGEQKYYCEGSESFNVTTHIINSFKQSVEAEGAKFVAVHLPVINNFAITENLFSRIFYGQDMIYENFLDKIKLNTDLVEIYPYLKNWIEDNSTSQLFMERHYSPVANELIAKRIYNYLNLNYKIFQGR